MSYSADEAAFLLADQSDRQVALELACIPLNRTGWSVNMVDHAEQMYQWLRARPSIAPVRITVGDPVITEIGTDKKVPLQREEKTMAVLMGDGDKATYPAAEALDSLGKQVVEPITISEDSNGAVVALTENPDGSSVFAATGLGVATLTWSDGTISFTDTITVQAGAPASIVVGSPVVEPQ